MPKVTLQFNLPEETEEFQAAAKAGRMEAALLDIGNDVFRPARKHGYFNKQLQELIEKNPDSQEIIGILEDMYYEILENYKL